MKPIRIMCQTAGADGAAMEYATFVVEQSFIKWVREVMAEVTERKKVTGSSLLYCFEFFCYSVVYGTDVRLVPDLDEIGSDEWHVVADAAHIADTQPPAAPTIKITTNDCLFKAYPRHADSPEGVTTPTITRANLDEWEALCTKE